MKEFSIVLAEALIKVLIVLLSVIRASYKRFSAIMKHLSGYQERPIGLTFVWSPPKELSRPTFKTLDVQLTTPVNDGLFPIDPNQESTNNYHNQLNANPDEDQLNLIDVKYLPNGNQLATTTGNQVALCESGSHLENYLDQLMKHPNTLDQKFADVETNDEQQHDMVGSSAESSSSGEVDMEFCPPQIPAHDFALRQKQAMEMISRGTMVAIVHVDASPNRHQSHV